MPRYEVKYTGSHSWEVISDIELMKELYRHYDRATPLVKKMLNGSIVQTSNAVYRLKWKGGDHEAANPIQELNETKSSR